jgi:hypothetical protein
MDQSPWAADISLASQEIARMLRNSELYLRVHNSPQLVCIFS